MRRVVLDSNAVDPLIDLPGAYEAVQAAVDGGRLEVLYTHVTIEELAATRDPDRRSRLLLAVIGLGRLVPTGAFALDVSRLGLARLSDDVDAVERLRSNNVAHTRDALIAVTAAHENCVLVTNEVRRLPARAREQGIEVITSAELLAWVGFDAAA
jgi:predicted nucleic acid-binding protein